MHLDLDDTITTAGFTPAALYIKAESSLGKASQLGLRQAGKEVADVIKHSRIGGRI